MRKLIESTFVTLDGVISDPHVWGAPYWDADHDAYGDKLLSASDALLLGRATYEGFAAAWPQRDDEGAKKMNAMPKYVASTTLTETIWNASIIHGDVVEEVAKLKQAPGGNILKYGTGSLSVALFENTLVDEYHLWTFPVLAGRGTRIFDGIDLTHLDLVDSTRFDSGIVVSVYAPKQSASLKE